MYVFVNQILRLTIMFTVFCKILADNWKFHFSYSRRIFNCNRLSYFSMYFTLNKFCTAQPMDITVQFLCKKYKYILKTFPKFTNIEDCTAMFHASSGSSLSQQFRCHTTVSHQLNTNSHNKATVINEWHFYICSFLTWTDETAGGSNEVKISNTDMF